VHFLECLYILGSEESLVFLQVLGVLLNLIGLVGGAFAFFLQLPWRHTVLLLQGLLPSYHWWQVLIIDGRDLDLADSIAIDELVVVGVGLRCLLEELLLDVAWVAVFVLRGYRLLLPREALRRRNVRGTFLQVA